MNKPQIRLGLVAQPLRKRLQPNQTAASIPEPNCQSTKKPTAMKKHVLTMLLITATSTVHADPAIDALRKERAELAAKPRPIFYANDGNDAYARVNAGTRETSTTLPKDIPLVNKIVERLNSSGEETDQVRLKFLTRRALQLVGTQVSTHAFNVVTASFPVVNCLRTKVGLPTHERAALLFDQGLCPLQMSIDLAREADMEIFMTLRMNEIHDGFGASHSLDLDNNAVKADHRDWLMQRTDKEPKRHGWLAFNYEIPEVRNMYLRFLREMCENYDIDGLDLDFMRFPILFRTVYLGQPATPEQTEILTGFLRDVRAMTEEVGLKRGRPILINARVADSLALNDAQGMDVKTWIKADLIDTVALGGRSMVALYETSIGELKPLGKPVYITLETSIGAANPRGNDGGTPPVQLRLSAEAARGRAAEAHGSGADGIYVLNYHLMRDYAPTLRQIGSPETLVGTDKDYFASWGLGESFGVPYEPFRTMETLCPASPRDLKPGEPGEATFPMFEDFEAARTMGKTPALILRLQIQGISSAAGLTLALNGSPLDLAGAKIQDGWLSVPIPESTLIRGRNKLEATLAPGTAPATLQDLVLAVRY